MPHKILLVDDVPQVIEGLKRALHKEPYQVLTANSAKDGLEILARQPVDVVVTDEMMPGMPGSKFLALVYQKYPDTYRIMLTGHANLELAVRAINEGHIYRFLIKPCSEHELSVAIRQAIQQKELAEKSRMLLKKVKEQDLILQRMEREHPGITKVERDATGTIVIDDAGLDLETLIKQIKTELGL